MRKSLYPILTLLLLAGVFLAGSWYGQRAAVTPATASPPEHVHHAVPVHATHTSISVSPGTVSITPEKQQLLGVRVSPVEKVGGTHTLRLLGRVASDETRTYKINAGIEGFIREVAPVTTGDHVKRDQLLATFSSPNAYNVIQLYILNLGAVDRLKQAAAAGSVEAQAAPAGAANIQQRVDQMESLGMSTLQMEEISRVRQVPASIKILAPADGVVLARNVFPGLKFDKGMEWYRIADLSRVWILADVFENEAQYLRPGQTVTVSLPQQHQTFQATVSPVRPQFDPASRTLKVRLEAENPGDILRPDMFVDVELPITHLPTITVPVDAIVDSGLKQTVFVDQGEGRFEPRPVETGARYADRVEIVKGLAPGERVVTAGTFLLDSESRMKLAGAGATGHIHEGHMHSPATGAESGKASVALAFASVIDPICGMEVDAAKAKTAGRVSKYGGKTYYFCSDDCKQKFDKDPARYAVTAAQTEDSHGSHDHSGHHHP